MAGQEGVAPSAGGLEAAAIEVFQTGLRGRLLRPGEAGYDDARRVWNGMIDRRPGLIAQCAGAADVIRAVQFARDHGLLVAVRGGGHSVAGKSVCDGGLMIDLSPMKSVRVDPAQRTARAEPGVTWREFDCETQAFGLAAPGGVVSSTGIAGLTLGGGVGWLVRKFGLTCDNLLSVDLVTADGRLLTADATQNSDLFWGVRGGGGNFGVVTSFEYRLHPVGTVLGGMVVHPRDRAREVLRFYRQFMQQAPEELAAYAGLLTSPEGVPVVAILVCYCGPLETGEAVVRPIREFGQPVADLIQPLPFLQMQTLLDPAFSPSGFQNYWKSSFLNDLTDDAIDLLIQHAARMPSPLSAVVVEHYGGAAGRVGVGETAFPHRQAKYDLGILSRWTDPAENERHIQWTRELWDAVQPFSSGRVYANFMGDESADVVRRAYGENYNRLVALKKQYDPTNLFRLNQNIPPTA